MVQNKCRLFAKQNYVENLKFQINFWNAGGLNNCKLLEFENLVQQNDSDLFVIIDAGSFCEKEEKIQNCFKNYQLKLKKRDRVISSGMIVGVRKELLCNFRIIKEMSNANTMEAILIVVWKNGVKFPCTAVYNPPRNIANFDLIEIEDDCLIFGDFNCPSERWNYKKTLPAGKNLEDFIDTHPINHVNSNKSNDYTFLSPSGSKTNPDLVLAHTNVKKYVIQKPIALLGSM